MRVVQRNLVYVIGLPLHLCREDTLAERHWFGAFGRVRKISVNRAPPPGTSCALNVPPWRSTMARAIERPRPTPPYASRPPGANGLNRFGRTSWAMPGPSSITSTRTLSCPARTRSWMGRRGGACLLAATFSLTWWAHRNRLEPARSGLAPKMSAQLEAAQA
jgi:hypothetical protein